MFPSPCMLVPLVGLSCVHAPPHPAECTLSSCPRLLKCFLIWHKSRTRGIMARIVLSRRIPANPERKRNVHKLWMICCRGYTATPCSNHSWLVWPPFLQCQTLLYCLWIKRTKRLPGPWTVGHRLSSSLWPRRRDMD